MPAKGKSRVTDSQRRAIAKGRLAGKPSHVIAKELALHPVTVRHQASDPRTVTMILSYKERHAKEFEKIFAKAVLSIDKRIDSKNRQVQYEACNQALKYITAGDPPLYRVGDQGTTDGDVTFEELMIVRRRLQQKQVS